jgi:hypothetical protein
MQDILGKQVCGILRERALLWPAVGQNAGHKTLREIFHSEGTMADDYGSVGMIGRCNLGYGN